MANETGDSQNNTSFAKLLVHISCVHMFAYTRYTFSRTHFCVHTVHISCVHLSRTHGTHFSRTHILRTPFAYTRYTFFAHTHAHIHTHTFYRLQTFRLWTLHIKFDRRPDGLTILSADMGECNLSY